MYLQKENAYVKTRNVYLQQRFEDVLEERRLIFRL